MLICSYELCLFRHYSMGIIMLPVIIRDIVIFVHDVIKTL